MGAKPTHVKGIAIIGIYVSDLQAAKDFYVNELGLEAQGNMGPGCMLALGETSFYLEGGRDQDQKKQKLIDADITICFEVESVQAAYQEIEKNSIEIVMKYTAYSPEYAVFMIADPDGNVIEIAGNP